MSKGIDLYFQSLDSNNDGERYNAFTELMTITEEKVTWFGKYKNKLIQKLQDKNSFQRSIGIMLLCNLGKSVEQKDLGDILSKLLPLVDDEKFITQRQYLQSIWKIAILEKKCGKRIITQLEEEFSNCTSKSHYNLLRKDILSGLVEIYKKNNDEGLKERVGELIEQEENTKYKKEYTKLVKEKEGE